MIQASGQQRVQSQSRALNQKNYQNELFLYCNPKNRTDKSLSDAENDIKASVLLISGYQDNQYSRDGDANDIFTSKLVHM